MPSVRLLLALVIALLALAPAAAQRKPAPPYRILVANDDGVRAPGIAAVAMILQAIGEVTIIAPSENHSGAGHSIVTSQPIFREDLALPNGLKAIGLTATPATTVNIAIKNIMTSAPDLVVSGINRGYNIGFSGYLSGTVGAAREAALHGIPAIAASLAEGGHPREYGSAAEEVLGVARRVKQYGLPRGAFLNVSIPARPADGYKGYMVTTQAQQRGGDESFAETRHPRNGSIVYWNVYKEGGKAPDGTDMWAVANGYVAVTPMRINETDLSQIDTLKGIFSK